MLAEGAPVVIDEQGFSFLWPDRTRWAGRRAWRHGLRLGLHCIRSRHRGELPRQRGLPLSRHFASRVLRVVRGDGVVISLRTVQRILARHHLKPWRY